MMHRARNGGRGWSAAATVVAVLSTSAGAEPIGPGFTYQGDLREGGVPANGAYDLRFSLYDAASGGSQVATTLCVDNLNITGGVFAVSLDFGAVFAGERRFLEVQVRGDTGLGCGDASGFVVLSRQELTASPFATYAMSAASAATATTASNASLFNGQGPSFYQNAANLTIGTLPNGRLSGAYTGVLNFSNVGNAYSGSGTGLTGLNAGNVALGTLNDARLSSNVAMLAGAQTFTGPKTFSAAASFSALVTPPFSVASTMLVTNLNADRLDGLDSTAFLQAIPVPLNLVGSVAEDGVITASNNSTLVDGAGVAGAITAATGTASGVRGTTDSTSGVGVQGRANATTGATTGVYGVAESSSGRGVFGYATAGSGQAYGGSFRSDSTGGRGVYGLANATTGTTTGVWGQSNSTSGRGLYGYASQLTGATFGVFGVADSTTGTAVFGYATATTGLNTGGSFRSDSTSGIGVRALASSAAGATTGVEGEASSSSGIGVLGEATSGSGSTFGVRGYAASSVGTGVHGWVVGTSGRAIFALSGAGTGLNYGVFADNASTGGRAVYGQATAVSGQNAGGWFESTSPSGFGVVARNVSSGTSAVGLYAESSGLSAVGVQAFISSALGTSWAVQGTNTVVGGRGVIGESEATTGLGIGVHAFSAGDVGRGVSASATSSTGTTYGVFGSATSSSGRGVYGTVSSTSASAYGVYGSATPPAMALYAAGNSGASGVKSFRIDHPADPQGKYLLHFSTEGPEVLNAYSGTAVLDAQGEAEVSLPSYFAAINTDPRYSLTPVGAPMPLLHVAGEIDESALAVGAAAKPGEGIPGVTFRIGGGVPHAKVSWRVEARRHDAWVRAYAPAAEVHKPESEQGTVQHPELFNLPQESRLGFSPEVVDDRPPRPAMLDAAPKP
ncbi:MAG: hypothetical protein HBSAPP03_05910 [Phycisphaerae bacterium]|nr:MAG: hypothetical protein HBSAPP03_05910 [Phycisphaerae bacterium]